MDKWILLEFNNMQERFQKYFEKYEVGLSMSELEKFFWDFCDNYIEIVKRRLYNPDIFGENKTESAKYACYKVLLGLLKLFAIYLPFITEEIYQSYFKDIEKTKSIHLTQIEKMTVNSDTTILDGGNSILEILFKVRQFKSENNYSLKEEINEVILYGYEKNQSFIQSVEYDLKAVGNIKNITFKDGNKKVEIIK